MAKGRMISKSISTSEKLASLYDIPMDDLGISNGAEFCSLLYTWTNLHTDDYGQLSAKPRSVKLVVLPASPRPVKDFEVALQILHQVRLISLHSDAQVLRIIDFEEHQKFRPDRPKINCFPELHPNGIPWYDIDIPMTTLSKEKLREVKLSKEEEKGETTVNQPASSFSSLQEKFLKIVKDYPKEFRLDERKDVQWLKDRVLTEPQFKSIDLGPELDGWETWLEAQHRLKDARKKNKFPQSDFKRSLKNYLSNAVKFQKEKTKTDKEKSDFDQECKENNAIIRQQMQDMGYKPEEL